MAPYNVLIPLDGSRLAEASMAYLSGLRRMGDLHVTLISAVDEALAGDAGRKRRFDTLSRIFYNGRFLPLLGGRSTVGQRTLTPLIGVRIPASQPRSKARYFSRLQIRPFRTIELPQRKSLM